MSTDLTTFDNLLAAVTVADGQPVYDPATGELIGHTKISTPDDVDAAVAKARQAQKSWGALSHTERSEYLHKAADAVNASAEALAQVLAREVGKPLNGPNARFEAGACEAWLRANADFPLEDEVLVDDESGKSVLSYVPIGVVGAIGPWNWPMMIAVWQLAPSLRMGNAVILKPSEHTPLSVQALVAVLNQVLPEGVLQVVPGEGDIGQAVSEHPDIDKIMFTGSTKTGQAIMRSAAADMKRVTLELGGNDAGIVLDDINVEDMAQDIFWGAFINTGQTCAALKRLYVPASIYDEVVQALAKIAAETPMGQGVSEENVLGPLQNAAQQKIVADLVEAARKDGATIVTGGNPDENQTGYFYPATIVSDIDQNNPLVQIEQFGPALPIIKYDDLDQAIQWANELEVGLGSSVWSSNADRARDVANRLIAGTTWINKHGAVDPRVPFGGVKKSGMGLEFGVEGLKQVALPKVTTL
ncbi:MAG TPA: aldehyde dehydrogenase family protein [Enteractinococcus helveticum]|uniref:Aldehyde dehydrogenase family protein n=1 Tax=Enteractinococcus helveticum TaxID=1837282 RepID=A0A921FPA7_9MICC|nr:aldehyde dehydrogenase family protein [Enteractinococcus helveticum]HJF14982.1 aldehyde dehydrogenase family protein [Enteractinococcus helveticum]